MQQPRIPCTAEEAVRWYRARPENEAGVRAAYLDLPVRAAAERYAASEEFAEIQRLLGPPRGRTLLDLGAGNGIASYAFARAAWLVTAFEPDLSAEIGAGAIEELVRETNVPIHVETKLTVPLPFADASFDVIFVRQVLHHLPDLSSAFHDMHRILRPGGLLLAIREHVASNAQELEAFRAAHPLHRLSQLENAFPLEAYVDAAKAAGFRVRHLWGMLESILNFAPQPEAQRQKAIRGFARARFLGLGRFLLSFPQFVEASARAHSQNDRTPGRLYSFLFSKPCAP